MGGRFNGRAFSRHTGDWTLAGSHQATFSSHRAGRGECEADDMSPDNQQQPIARATKKTQTSPRGSLAGGDLGRICSWQA
jgi:hypothetical protein